MPTQTSFSGPPQWLTPYYQNFLNGAFGVANRPYQQYQGPRVAGMSDIQSSALGGMQGFMGSNPYAGAQSFLGSQMQNQNPYIQQMGQTITQDAMRGYEQALGSIGDMFSESGFGGPRHGLAAGQATEAFGRGLGNALGNLQFGAWNDAQNRGMQAAGMTGQLNNSLMNNYMMALSAGNVPRGIQQQFYDADYGDWMNQWNYPINMTNNLANWLGVGGQFNQQTTETPDPNRASQMLGGAMFAWPFLFGSGGLFG